MNDIELLEYAAKAAGYTTIQYQNLKDSSLDDRYGVDEAIWNGEDYWNPLTDDGDALRLAVKLSIDFYTGEDDGVAIYAGYFDVKDNYRQKYKVERVSNDPYSATRRAIVRCAAEIGKGMT